MPTPHYANPPEPFKWNPPNTYGPFRKAPDEYGGEWWYVSPFLQEPWIKEFVPAFTIPDDFKAVFGEMPTPHADKKWFQEWKKNLDDWVGIFDISSLDSTDVLKLNQANQLFTAFGLGNAAIYNTKSSEEPKVRFPSSGHPEYDSWLSDILYYPDIEVLTFQLRQVTEWGETPSNFHPFFPQQLRPEGS